MISPSEDNDGLELCWYDHGDEEYKKLQQYYYLLHVELVASDKAFKKNKLSGFRVVESPIVKNDGDMNI